MGVRLLSSTISKDKRAKQWYSNCHSTVTTPLTPQKIDHNSSNFAVSHTESEIQAKKDTRPSSSNSSNSSNQSSNSSNQSSNSSNSPESYTEYTIQAKNGEDTRVDEKSNSSIFFSPEPLPDIPSSEITRVDSKNLGSEGAKFEIGSKLRHRDFSDASECEVAAKPIKKSKSVAVAHNFQVGDGVKVNYTVGDHHFFHPIAQITEIDGDRIHTDKGSFYAEDLELLDF